MKPHSGLLPVESRPPLMGLATSPPSHVIQPGYSPNLLNMVVRDGVVRRRSGYLQLGQQLSGRVMGFVEFGEVGETPVLVAFTESSQYYYDVDNATWVDLTNEETDTFVINIADTANKRFTHNAADLSDHFPIGSKFIVTGSTGNDRTYTVDSIFAAGPPFVVQVDEGLDDADDTADGNLEPVVRFPIDAVATGPDFFTVSGDQTGYMTGGDSIHVRGSTDNDGVFTIIGTVYINPNTLITVNETIDDSVADGTITVRQPVTTPEETT